jgi:hypothetical protein
MSLAIGQNFVIGADEVAHLFAGWCDDIFRRFTTSRQVCWRPQRTAQIVEQGLRNGTEPLNERRGFALMRQAASSTAPVRRITRRRFSTVLASRRKPARGRLAASRWFTIRSRRLNEMISPFNR